MKTKLLLISAMLGITLASNAQIPNSGFENWTTIGNYMEPQGYLTPNPFSSSSFYPVTRDVSHFPALTGNYSIRIENKPSLLPNGEAKGIALQNNSNNIQNGPGRAFPIIGHPTSLTGYYKYAPLNGDTMMILIILYQNGGSNVSSGQLLSTASVPNWTSFNISLSAYTTADSGTILLSAYNAGPNTVPHGNSVLNVDNLNFDNLVTTDISEAGETNSFNIFPNPSNGEFTLTMGSGQLSINNYQLLIYNVLGEKVFQSEINSPQSAIHLDFPKGMYFAEFSNEHLLQSKKIIIQ